MLIHSCRWSQSWWIIGFVGHCSMMMMMEAEVVVVDHVFRCCEALWSVLMIHLVGDEDGLG